MCNLSDVVEESGIQKGRREADILSLKALMRNMKMPVEQALAILETPEEKWQEYRNLLAQQ